MSDLNRLLNSVVERVNSSVKTTAQSLTEEQKTQARENIGVDAPDYVKEEASAVVDKALSRDDDRVFRFIAFSDAHQNNDNESISNGNRDAGYGMAEILRLIGVDLVTFLGDSTWGASTNTVAETVAQAKQFNRYFADALKGETQIRIEGNHDDANYATDATADAAELTPSDMYALFYSYNKGCVFDPNHIMDGYCYRDFDGHKVRVVALNTNQGLGDGGVINGYQLKWFAETALDMFDKTDWSLMILSHQPLDYPMPTLCVDACAILKAFITGGSVSLTTRDTGETISMDYADKNCTFIANFHGHVHAFSVVEMERYVSADTYEGMNAYAVAIPNACFGRNNQYSGESYADFPRLQRYTTEETYNKTSGTAQSTSFNLITVCLDKKIIYADNYGAGIDREIPYDFELETYTNLVPTAVANDGATIYGTNGYQDGVYVSSNGSYGTDTSFTSTGNIKMTYDSPIYIKGNELAAESHTRLYSTRGLYGEDNYSALANGINNQTSGSNALSYWYDIETLGEKYYKLTPTTALFERCASIGVDNIGYYYLRLSVPGTGDTLIVTDNQPIE